MNIAILTLPLHQNYGGIMQCLALQTFLTRQGHKVTVLDRHRNHQNENIGSRIYGYVSQNLLHHNVQTFINNNIHRTSPITSQSQLEMLALDFDAIIVGSDQVWRLSMVKGVETNYFLDFAESAKKKIAYSASFGTDKWEGTNELTAKITDLIHQFDAVSVREVDGVGMADKLFSVSAVQTLDPVLLHDKSFYESVIHAVNPVKYTVEQGSRDFGSKGEVLGYFLGDRKDEWNTAKELATILDGKLHAFRPHWQFSIGKFSFSNIPSPAEWLEAFQRARFIVTDSFHGVAFSIIFRKPFVVLPHKSGGLSRILSILSSFHLDSRLINEDDVQHLTAEWLMNVPFDEVEAKLAEARKFSADWLINSLKS